MSVEQFHRTCPICEACCGLLVEVDKDSGHAIAVKGDADDPFSRGYLCPKSQALIGVVNDPDRLRRPLRRDGNRFVEIEWSEAFDLVASRLGEIRERHGANGVGFYIGNPTANNPGLALYSGLLVGTLGTKQIYTAGSIDAMPRFLASAALYGDKALIPLPDVDRTDFLLIVGANPEISNGSLLTAPGMPNRLRALQERGGSLVVVDPRRTETAALADRHIAIRPSGDAAMLLAMVRELFAENLVDTASLAPYLRNMDAVRALVAPFTAEAVEPATGVDPEVIRSLVRQFATARSAAAYGRIGACCQPFGTLANWALDLLNILTGNLDRSGGVLFGQPVPFNIFSRDPYVGDQAPFGRYHSRVSGYPEVARQFPVIALAEEIETPGEGQIRGMVTMAGNPLLSLPDSARLIDAFQSLEFMVSIDLYLNETTRLADVILPPIDHLHRSGFTFHFSNNMIRSYAKAFPAILPRPDDSYDDWEIMLEISARISGEPRARLEQKYLRGLHQRIIDASSLAGKTADELGPLLHGANGPEKIYDLLLRVGEYGDKFGLNPDGISLEKLRRYPSGLDLGPLDAGRIGQMLRTPDRKIDLSPEAIVTDLDRLAEWMESCRNDGEAGNRFLLTSRRGRRSMNSWLHNVEPNLKATDRNVLFINPRDADRLGLYDGQAVRISANGHDLVVPIEITDTVQTGIVNMAHGWGHDVKDVRMRVARRNPGANFNLLLGTAGYDVPSGNASFNGTPVVLEPA